MHAILLTGVLAIVASALGQLVAGAMTNRRARTERFVAAKRELYLTALRQVSAPEGPDLAGTHMRVGVSLALFDSRVAEAYSAAVDTKFVWDREMHERFDHLEGEAIKRVREEVMKGDGDEELEEVVRDLVRAKIGDSLRAGDIDVASPAAVAWAQAFTVLGNSMRKSLGLRGGFSYASPPAGDSPER